MNIGNIRELVGVNVVDRHSADCWLKEKTRIGGINREVFTLNIYIGSSTHPVEFENVVLCYLYQPEVPKSRTGLIYLGDKGIENESQKGLLKEILDAGIALCMVARARGRNNDRTSFKRDEFSIEEIMKDIVGMTRALGYMRLRRDLVDANRIYLWGEGSGGISCLFGFILDDLFAGVVAESTPNTFELIGETIKERHFRFKFADLSLLASMRPIGIINPIDEKGMRLENNELERMFAEVIGSYMQAGKGSRLRVVSDGSVAIKETIGWLLTEK